MHPEGLTPSPTRKEKERPTELLGAADVGLQARLLLGDLSNPHVGIKKKNFQPIQDNGALGINERVGNMYQKASLTQRSRYQQEEGLTYARWRDGFNTYLDKIRSDTEHDERKAFLQTLGMSDTVTADDFYEEYLNGKSDIIKFVDTVETQASREQILNHEDIIRQLGNAFGYESSEVIEHLIHGVRNVKTDSDRFISEAKRKINTIEVVTHPLLRKIQEDSGEEAPQREQGEVVEEAEPAAESPPESEPPPARPHYTEIPVSRVYVEENRPAAKKTTPTATMAARRTEPQKIQKRTPAPHPEQKPAKKADVPEGEKQKENQVYPAPKKQGQTEYHLITGEELDAAGKLLYNDVFRQNRERQANMLRVSEITNNYARELYAMMQEYGRTFVLEKATNAVQTLENVIKDLGLKRDKRSRSRSWYLWGIAKSRFLANNPDVQITLRNAKEYEPSDPLLHYRTGTHSAEGQKSHNAEEAIINGMIGWEVYRQRKKVNDIILYLQTLLTDNDVMKLQGLLAEPAKKDFGTLSSYQLREIGRLVRNNK